MSEAEPPRLVDDARSTRGDDDREEVKEVKKEEIRREEITPDGRTVEKVEKRTEKEEFRTDDKHRHHEPDDVEHVRRTTTTTTVIDPPDHHHRHQDLAIVVPRGQSDRELRREIRALEEERRALRYDRGSDWGRLEEVDRRRSGGDWDMVIREHEHRDYHDHHGRNNHHHHHRRPREVVRVEQDRKGRMALVRSRN
jgi:hypothetical protein